MKKIINFLLVLLICYSCADDKTKYMPTSVGKINSLSIVISNELWNSRVGDTLRNYFAAPVEDIPGEKEPLFSIQQLPHQIFTGTTRYGRNVLVIDIDKKNGVTVRDTLFASPQKVAFIVGETTDDIVDLAQKNAQKIVQIFRENELKETQRRFSSSLNLDKTIEEKLGVKFKIPSSFSIVKQEDNFFWLERKIKGGTSNIIVYEMPLNSIEQKENETEFIIKMRDSIGKRYIPGREEGMYMITSQAYAPSIYKQTFKDRTIIETRGLWRVKDFVLGGPFINYVIENPEKNRCLVVEGFVSAPGTPKRDYLFEIEAIIKTFRFN